MSEFILGGQKRDIDKSLGVQTFGNENSGLKPLLVLH